MASQTQTLDQLRLDFKRCADRQRQAWAETDFDTEITCADRIDEILDRALELDPTLRQP